MKTYRAFRQADVACIEVSDDAGRTYALPIRQDVRNHSPDGVEWGYGGSGPAQCALAILCDLLDDPEHALRLYQEFKQRVIAKLPREGWELTSPQLMAVVLEIEEEAAAQR